LEQSNTKILKEYFKTERTLALQNHRTSHYILQKKSCTTRPKLVDDGLALKFARLKWAYTLTTCVASFRNV